MVTINFNYKTSFYNKIPNIQYFVMNWEQIVDFWKFKREYEIKWIRDYDETRQQYFYYEIDETPQRLDKENHQNGLWIVKCKLNWDIKVDDLFIMGPVLTMEEDTYRISLTCNVDYLRKYNLITTENLRNELIGEK